MEGLADERKATQRSRCNSFGTAVQHAAQEKAPNQVRDLFQEAPQAEDKDDVGDEAGEVRVVGQVSHDRGQNDGAGPMEVLGQLELRPRHDVLEPKRIGQCASEEAPARLHQREGVAVVRPELQPGGGEPGEGGRGRSLKQFLSRP